MKTYTILFKLLALPLVCGLLSTGCHLGRSNSAGFASVVIGKQPPEKIRQAATDVFQANGYNLYSQSADQLVFQRDATRREQVGYVGFAAAHEGELVVIRVRVDLHLKSPVLYSVACNAYAVSNPGSGVFEKTNQLFDYQSGPYQKLLDQIPQRLLSSAPSP